jgi:hypothetical protein
MRSVSLLLLGLLALSLAGPLGLPAKAECRMSCCRPAAAHVACGMKGKAACSIGSCNRTGSAAELPSLPLSTLAVGPRLADLVESGVLARLPRPAAESLPGALPERPPRA